jgi:cell wall-associated NlpC family hydrolase
MDFLLLKSIRKIPDLESRLSWISSTFLGRPYIADSLIGSASAAEVFTYTFDGFDCVTYVETVLALAGARSGDAFVERLKAIRYKGGQTVWRQRNHYMTTWILNNIRAGFVRSIELNAPARWQQRVLSVVPGLPPRKRRFACIPKQFVRRTAGRIQSGDLIFFASTRPHLDVFHCGLIVRDRHQLLLRHASRSQGRVVEQELSTFLRANRMSGVMLVRPLERGR